MAASPAPAGPPVWAPLPLPPPPTFSTVANEYRVCKATQWDNVTADGVDAQDKLVSTVHVVCSMLSAICCLCVLVVSMRYPALRKFPANMLLWKTACDLLTSGIIVGLNIALLSMGEDYDYTHGSALCANGVLAGLTAFALLASPGWFFALAYNLNRSLHDPFTRPQSRMTKFHLWVWLTSGVVGITVGNLHEYRPNLHLCWSCHGVHPIFSWLFLFGWLILYWAGAAAIMFDAYYWMVHSRRITERLSSRSKQLSSSILYVAIIGSQWALAAITFALIFEPEDKWAHGPLPRAKLSYRILFACVLGLLGITDAASWLATSHSEINEMRQRRRLLRLIALEEGASDAPEAAAGGGGGDGGAAAGKAAERLPTWYGVNKLTSGKRKAAKKKAAKSENAEIGDVSEALRREFVQHAVAGVARSLRETTSNTAKRTAEFLAKGHSRAEVPKPRGRTGGEIELREAVAKANGGGSDEGGQRLGRGGRILRPDDEEWALPSSHGTGAMPEQQRRHTSMASSADERIAPETANLPPEAQLPVHAFSDEPREELTHDVYFRDLAPEMFATLRRGVFNVTDDQYVEGLQGEGSGLRGLSTRAVVDQMVLSFSEGKGGGFFFWSIDKRFMVKTLEGGEYKGLKTLLPSYYRHMWQRRRSLLPRFYGAYSITIQNHEKFFVVMESVFRSAPSGKVHQCYDLKGSWIDRHSGVKAMHGGTLKDMDLHKPLKLADGIAEGLLDDLRHDTQLLCSHNLMDYSLLLGVHNQAVATEGLPGLKVKTTDGGVVADEVDVPGYYMGLIDILQAWNLSKRIERYSKIIFKGRWAKEVKDGMSAIEPTAYRERFLAGIGHQLGVTATDGNSSV